LFSDHISPWLASQGRSLNAWAVLGTLGQAAIVKQLEQAPARIGRLRWRIRFRDRGLWEFVAHKP
jgi:hypothetical protein